MLLRGGYDEKSWEMACNWLMMTSSGDNNDRVEVWVCSPTKLNKIPKIPKAEQETAQPTAARFKNSEGRARNRPAYGCAVWKNKPKAKHDPARLRLRGKKKKTEGKTWPRSPTAPR